MYQWDKDEIIFVIMLKESIKYDQVKELALPEENNENIIKDEIIKLTGEQTKTHYLENLRRVAIYSDKEKRVIEIITNNFTGTAFTISELYKQRRMIEIFFKKLKQHLKIKSFIGTSENAMWI